MSAPFIRAVHVHNDPTIPATVAAIQELSAIVDVTHFCLLPYWHYSSYLDPMSTSPQAVATGFTQPVQGDVNGSDYGWFSDSAFTSGIQQVKGLGKNVIIKPMIDPWGNASTTVAFTANGLAGGGTLSNIASWGSSNGGNGILPLASVAMFPAGGDASAASIANAELASSSLAVQTASGGYGIITYTGTRTSPYPALTGCTYIGAQSGSPSTVSDGAVVGDHGGYNWRGNVCPGASYINTWMASYIAFIQHYAALAGPYCNSNDVFICGTELSSLFDNYPTKFSGAGGVIPTIRANTSCKVSYAGYLVGSPGGTFTPGTVPGNSSGNFGYTVVASSLDYLGQEAYFDISGGSPGTDLSVATYRSNFVSGWTSQLAAASAYYNNMPILFTEFGINGTTLGSSNGDGSAADFTMQASCYQAIVQECEQGNHTWYAGSNTWGCLAANSTITSSSWYGTKAMDVFEQLWGQTANTSTSLMTPPTIISTHTDPDLMAIVHVHDHVKAAYKLNRIAYNVTAQSSNYWANPGDIVLATSGSSNIYIALPAVFPNVGDDSNQQLLGGGRSYVVVKKVDNGSGSVIVLPCQDFFGALFWESANGVGVTAGWDSMPYSLGGFPPPGNPTYVGFPDGFLTPTFTSPFNSGVYPGIVLANRGTSYEFFSDGANWFIL